jgi:metallophosphoesterase (TIGR03768 family)
MKKKNSICINSFLLMGFAIILANGCRKDDSIAWHGYPIDSKVYTTLDRTVIPVAVPANSPVIFPYEISKFAEDGYGVWEYGPGLNYEQRLQLMPDGYSTASVSKTARLLTFFTMSDIHLTDKESPAQQICFGYKGGNSSAYSPVILYTTHVLDAAIQTINALNKINKFDFGMGLGDAANNAQYNELRWYIDIFDGKNINPGSGVQEDPVPGANNDYQDEYTAKGLNREIPWYQVLGNHDHFSTGVFTPDDYVRQAYVGGVIMNLGNIMTDPLGINSRGFYMGAVDGRTPDGDIFGAGPVDSFQTPPLTPADLNRHPLTRKDWMSEFFNTSSKPVGHGFTQANLDNDLASYSFEPKSGLPIKIIVLDDTQDENNDDTKEQGYLDNQRFDWLVSELDEGQLNGKLMIIAAHIPVMFDDYDSHSQISEKTLTDKLNTYPNLLMWISGHVHRNTVTMFKSPVDSLPELGFWHVETSSLRDFPQQFRTFEIDRNSDSTISIFITNVDPAVKDGSFAALSRSYAIATQEIFNNQIIIPPSGSYNAELVKPLSPEMKTKIQKYGTSILR